ncbi:hypothetical protein JAAARDRAFT_197573 [Jaapia argillacea MUCL 33604]|uniref:F-box domain-containing protein n=1 Tax=Jaapia argillacea MUCL 33604 TaxID=933084 RepID=A0A067PQ55_9AGAM|nr:hypothetical protein JAAARDRAFT_197573 [Jaapia argillacea MUCL 33604]
MPYAQVFSIEELSREICWHLNDSENFRNGTLASLARSCGSFLEPALDVLWYTMRDMEPLLKLIPALEVSDKENDYGQLVSYYNISYPLEERDWTRFDYYARRIRILYFSHYGEIDCAIYSRLSQYTISPSLIPSLRSLSWFHRHPTQSFASFTSEVNPFLTPSLQTLCIENESGYEEDDIVDAATSSEQKETLRAFFHMLSGRCPSVQSLTLYGDLREVSLGFLSKFRNLKEVKLTGHSTKVDDLSITFEALSVLPHLEKIHNIDLSTGPGVVSCTPGFPSLSHISTRSGDSTNILSILQCISSPSLQSFSSFQSFSSWQDLEGGSNRDFLSCTSLLASKFSTTLQQVTIYRSHRCPVEQVGLSVFDTLLRGLPHLRHFRLALATGDQWPTMTDDQVKRMTQAWPSMEDLAIQHSISLPSLKTITHAWPNLTSLTFPTLYISTPDLKLTYESHPLRNLSISAFSQTDPSSSPHDIARVIDAMFPKLIVDILATIRCEVMAGVERLQMGRA